MKLATLFLFSSLAFCQNIFFASNNAPPPTAATPTFSPGAGSYSSTQSVTISTSTSGCGSKIYWSTSHNPPTTSDTNSTSVSVAASETVYAKVIGCTGYVDSSVGSAVYTISGPPTFVTAVSGYAGGTTTAISTASSGQGNIGAVGAGNIVVLVIGDRSTGDAAYINSVTGNGGADTFTKFSTSAVGSTYMFEQVWVCFNATASSNYIVTANINASFGTSNPPYSAAVFTKGSLTGAFDGAGCSSITGISSPTCSSALTITGTEIVVAGWVSYDGINSGTPAANSPLVTPPVSYGVGGNPSSGISYYISSSSGTATPGFTNIGAGDPTMIVGALIK